jgi:hypothetical protein
MLKTSADLGTHVAIILGVWDELQTRPTDPDAIKSHFEIKAHIEERVAAVADDPIIKDTLAKIKAMRQEVARQVGIKTQIEDLNALTDKIRKQLFSRGFRSGKELYVQTLSQGLGLFAMAFHGKAILYRTTDFKSTEYRNLLGGNLFETLEDNPMLGYRGVSRNLHDWEIESFKLARGIFGGKNLHIMLPFVRTVEEATAMKRYLEQVHKLHSGDEGLKIFIMSEIPSNAILAKQFIQDFDGFSIGSNDMTQMVLATDRDNASLRHIYDERSGRGLGPARDHLRRPEIRQEGGLLRPGRVQQPHPARPGRHRRHRLRLGRARHLLPDQVRPGPRRVRKSRRASSANGWPNSTSNASRPYSRPTSTSTSSRSTTPPPISRTGTTASSCGCPNSSGRTWKRPRPTSTARKWKPSGGIHKPVLYASWDWPSTVFDAPAPGGFDNYEEQEKALAVQRAKKW